MYLVELSHSKRAISTWPTYIRYKVIATREHSFWSLSMLMRMGPHIHSFAIIKLR